MWVLRDLGSTNGTTVNGRRVIGASVVRDGDQIGFGRMMFRLAVGLTGAGPPAGARPKPAARPCRAPPRPGPRAPRPRHPLRARVLTHPADRD